MIAVPLTRGRVAFIDEVDAERVSTLRWHFHAAGYAATRGGRVLLHRFILDAPSALEVDHINGNGLDCRRSNLRLATHKQNLRNQAAHSGTSRYKGVSWNRQRNGWDAQICLNGKNRYLGRFRTEVEAAKAYNEGARLHFGEFARLNEV